MCVGMVGGGGGNPALSHYYMYAGLHLGGGVQGGIRPPFVASCPPKFFSGFTCSTLHTFKRATLSSTFCPPIIHFLNATLVCIWLVECGSAVCVYNTSSGNYGRYCGLSSLPPSSSSSPPLPPLSTRLHTKLKFIYYYPLARFRYKCSTCL